MGEGARARGPSAGADTVVGVDGGTQLGFDFPTTRLVRVTPSKLATWDDCPRRYRLTYLDRPAPSRGGARAGSTLGAVVHLALRALFDLPPARRTPEAAAALVDRYWSSEGFRDAAQADEYRERARGWLADYAAELEPDAETVGLERWVSVATDRIVAEGRADRIDRRGDELVVVDYKTGRRRPTPDDTAASQALALYAVAAERTLHRRCTQVELHHLPSGEVAAWRHDPASLQGHVRRAETTAEELDSAAGALAAGGGADALFPARPAPRCGRCDVRRHCPQGRAAAPEEPPWAGLAP
ncbi:RecB family exonuclease [Pseudonocardia kunmingensis]|uniref:RecB family exonuclease n=1 Tax=Pseudonocardia kunmingensis TaxID=630975 RepID=A0A543CYW8_9PSEU|nr:RecB family exonuclease [Pseudonocardia kunmingensis]